MANWKIFLIFTLFLEAQKLSPLAKASKEDYVREACNATRYRNLCVHSLSPFSDFAKRSTSRWARVSISVTLREVKRENDYLVTLMSRLSGRNRIALADCIEVFEDAIDELHRSLWIVRNLDAETFDTQMSDLITWMSAVLTDEETCLDGFEGQRGREVGLIRNRVGNVSHVTSNALALAAKLADSGLGKE